MDPHGTIDTFYVGFKEEFKVLKTFLKRIPCDHARLIGTHQSTGFIDLKKDFKIQGHFGVEDDKYDDYENNGGEIERKSLELQQATYMGVS